MATLRDCFFAYNHELAGANLDEEVRIVTVKRVDLDYEFRVCEICAKGMLETGNFVLASEEEVSDEGMVGTVVEEVTFGELLEGAVEENADAGEGDN